MTTANDAPRRLIGYARVSTDEQAEQGSSLEAQKARIAAWCASQGHALIGVVLDDGRSAKDLERPGAQAVLAAVRDGSADGIAVAKLDRLSRSVRDLLDLFAEAKRRGWAIVSVSEMLDTESPIGRFVVLILAGMAELEREVIADRTRITLQHMKRQGRRVGSLPYGWRLMEGSTRGELVPDDDEQAVVAQILGLDRQGVPPGSVAARLNAAGIPARGERWHRTTVRRILQAEGERVTLQLEEPARAGGR